MTNTRILTIAAGIAVLAAVLAAGVQRLLGAGASAESVTGQVMCAKTELPAGHRLVEGDLEPRQGNLGSGTRAASTEARQLIGRTLSAPMRTGQIIRQEHLAARGSGADIASQLPSGHRAITVVLRDPVAATSLFPGAWVDVLVTMDRGGPANKGDAITRVAIERARVLALADDGSAARAAAAANDIGTGSERRPVPIKKVAVTLDVTVAQAAELELAASRGTVGLAIRPESDTTSANGSATTQGMLGSAATGAASADRTASTGSAPPAASAKPATWDVIVIRGDERVKHDFPERTTKPNP